jgi:hypothetical protein
MFCKEWSVRRLGLILTATLLTITRGANLAQAQTTVGFEIGAVNVAGSSASIKVVLNAASADAVAVQYATQDGTAVSPGDYTATTGTVVVPAGFTSQTFTINGINSAAAGKNFTATLANPVNATLGTSLVKITIDAAPPGGGGVVVAPPGGGTLPAVQFASSSLNCGWRFSSVTAKR